uniref:Secreted protein n=1 Tax=Globodera rostochiensis TaxID=31243 RepID=A0A914GRD4_GLORO
MHPSPVFRALCVCVCVHFIFCLSLGALFKTQRFLCERQRSRENCGRDAETGRVGPSLIGCSSIEVGGTFGERILLPPSSSSPHFSTFFLFDDGGGGGFVLVCRLLRIT